MRRSVKWAAMAALIGGAILLVRGTDGQPSSPERQTRASSVPVPPPVAPPPPLPVQAEEGGSGSQDPASPESSGPSGEETPPPDEAPPQEEEEIRRPGLSPQCRAEADCRPGETCLPLPGNGMTCGGQACTEDKDCPSDRVCRGVVRTGDGGYLHRCQLYGHQREGQPCSAWPSTVDEACQPDLLCTADDRCGRPCNLQDPSSCPSDSTCIMNGFDRPSCLPVCASDSDCPRGQRCLTLPEADRECGILTTPDCGATGCPEGELCTYAAVSMGPRDLRRSENYVMEFRMHCARPCGEQAVQLAQEAKMPGMRDLDAGCPEASVCGIDSFCHPLCQTNADCQGGDVCVNIGHDEVIKACDLFRMGPPG